MKATHFPALLAALILAACTTISTKTPPGAGASASGKPPEATSATQQLADALQLLSQQDFAGGESALQRLIDSRAFDTLPAASRYQALATAGKSWIRSGYANPGYGDLSRAVAMPEAAYEDAFIQVLMARQLRLKNDAVNGLASLMRRWPEQALGLDERVVSEVTNDAYQLPHGAALPLLQSMYDIHWKLPGGLEPSGSWRDLSLLLLEHKKVSEAVDVAAHVTDVYMLVSMRSDRRFDALVAANPGEFDIAAALDREMKIAEAIAAKAPHSLAGRSYVIDALMHHQRYGAMLAATDAVVVEAGATNYPERLFEDYDKEFNWILDSRATALEFLGRWDEAVEQLTKAGRLSEDHFGNVSQLINLGTLYCRLGRPNDALAAIGRMKAKPSDYGVMEEEVVRLEAALQLGDSAQVTRSLEYLKAHREVAPFVYERALFDANQVDEAARMMIAGLRDPGSRLNEITRIQIYGLVPETPWDTLLRTRRRGVIDRPDVQAEINKIGRVDEYNIPDIY